MIDILMATYNGSKYIEDQISSLRRQSFTDWRLLVHDDGSSDDTVSKLKANSYIDNRIEVIEDGIVFSSAGGNFFHLLKFVKKKYIIFCDQDDIWFDNKLRVMIDNIISLDTDAPIAVFAGGFLLDNEQGPTKHEIYSYRPDHLREQLFLNAGLQGCSLMFNKQLLNIITQYKGSIAMHDHLITIAALTFGSIIYIDQKLMWYRQNHDDKATANMETNRKRRWLKNIIDKQPVIDLAHYKVVQDFYNCFQTEIELEKKKLFTEYLSFPKTKNFFRKINVIYRNKFSLGGNMNKLLVKILLRPTI